MAQCKQQSEPERCSYPHCNCHPTTIGDLVNSTMSKEDQDRISKEETRQALKDYTH